MMKPAYFANRNDLSLPWFQHRERFPCIFVQGQMRPTPVIIGKVRFEQTIQVNLVEHDDVI
jgi:hypothetical protein